MNKVILSGYVVRDPEIRTTSTDKTVATFGLSVQRGWKKAEGSQYPPSDIFNIVAWERRAEFCRNYIMKGSRIIVEGQLQSRTYEAQDGSKRYITEIVANEIEFAGAKNARPGEGGGYDGGSDPRPTTGNAPEHVDDMDIPF